MAAGGAGVVGFGLWAVQLLAGGHDLVEFLAMRTDGVTNAIVFAGSAMVLVGGWLGRRSEATGARLIKQPKVKI